MAKVSTTKLRYRATFITMMIDEIFVFFLDFTSSTQTSRSEINDVGDDDDDS